MRPAPFALVNVWRPPWALPESYLTVWGAIGPSLALARGQTLLVRGATASLSLAAIAHAKSLGAVVVATSRSEPNLARRRDVGADFAIVDGGQSAEEVRRVVPGGVDVAIEVVGAASTFGCVAAAHLLP